MIRMMEEKRRRTRTIINYVWKYSWYSIGLIRINLAECAEENDEILVDG